MQVRGREPRRGSTDGGRESWHAGLTPQVVTDAALRLIKRDGVTGLSMRRLAGELGVRAPSLYAHVASKDALLALVAGRLYGSPAVGTTAMDGVDTLDQFLACLHDSVVAVRRLYLEHPGIAAVMLAHMGPERHRDNDPRAATINAEVAAMIRLGVAPEEARRRYETTARWTIAAMLAEELPHPAPDEDEQKFLDGLGVYLDGERVQLTRLLRLHRPTG